jgi:hypothetical protein
VFTELRQRDGMRLYPGEKRVRQRLRLALCLVIVYCGGGSFSGCSKDPEIRAVELTKEVEAAFAQQKWELGEKKAREILALSSLSPTSRDQAKLKLDQARSEQQAKQQYVRFMGHKDADSDVAVAAFRDMPEDSYYRQLALKDYERIRSGFISDHLEKAEAARDNGRCADWKAQVQMVLDVDPQNQKAMDLGKKPCTKKE